MLSGLVGTPPPPMQAEPSASTFARRDPSIFVIEIASTARAAKPARLGSERPGTPHLPGPSYFWHVHLASLDRCAVHAARCAAPRLGSPLAYRRARQAPPAALRSLRTTGCTTCSPTSQYAGRPATSPSRRRHRRLVTACNPAPLHLQAGGRPTCSLRWSTCCRQPRWAGGRHPRSCCAHTMLLWRAAIAGARSASRAWPSCRLGLC